mgnify:CR=1 FL=1
MAIRPNTKASKGKVRQIDKGYAHFDTWAEEVEAAEERALRIITANLGRTAAAR